MELTPRLRLMNWLVRQGLEGLPENDLLRGFCERCRAEGLPLSRGLVVIDTLHPSFEGRGFRWNDKQTNESEVFEYGSSAESARQRRAWRRSPFFHMLEHGHEELLHRSRRVRQVTIFRWPMTSPPRAISISHLRASFRRGGHDGRDGLRLFELADPASDQDLARRGLEALRDLVPVLGLAVKSGAQADIARTLGRVYLGHDAAEQVLRGKISRGMTERITTVLWFSDLRGSTAISESIEPGEIIPFLNDYAQASIDAIHDAGGQVLKLIGDGVLAMFTNENMAVAKRAALRAEHRFRHNMDVLNARRSADGRPVTTAHVGLHIGEVFYGNIGSDDRLDFTVVGPAVNEVSRIASMCRSVDRELLTSSEFRNGLDTAGRGFLVSTGRFALRGVSRAQDLYTLEPDILTDEVVAGKYARYVAG